MANSVVKREVFGLDTGDDNVDRLGKLIEFSGEWALVHRASELPPLISPYLSEMFGIDCGFWVYYSKIVHPARPYVYHAFGALEHARVDLQNELDRGRWFYRLGESVPPETWVDVVQFPKPIRQLLSSRGLCKASIWPIRFAEELVGFLTFGRTTEHPNQDEGTLRQGVRLITLVLNLIILKRRAEFDSYTDPLTRLHNRRGLEQTWSKWRTGVALCDQILVGMVDLNNLKQINDVDGHSAGDNALLYIADWLRQVLGEQAFLCRWGGDEFAFSVTTGSDAASLERHLNDLGLMLPYKVSVGVAALLQDGRNLDECLRVADERMYAAKSSTRMVPL